jgi:PST family polysaccharide transporter
MGKDFYPRLAAASNSLEEAEIINEQTEIGMLLAAPGLLFTLALSPIIIPLLYSHLFVEAVPILQWILLGVFLRIVSWPLGYLFIARAKSKLFFFSEAIANGVHLLFAYLLIDVFGLLGLGLAFCALYMFYTIYVRIVAGHLSGFSWSFNVIKTAILIAIIFIFSIVIISLVFQVLATLIVFLTGLVISFFAIKRIMKILCIGTFKELMELINMKLKLKKAN